MLPKDRALLTEYSIEFESRKNSAIYFLPGYLATQLYKSDSDELVWVDLGLTSPLISDVASHGLENWEPLVGLDINGDVKPKSTQTNSSLSLLYNCVAK